MKKQIIKLISFILVLAVIIGACLFYSSQKSGMFIDEIYSYGLSNGYYTPFLTYLRADGLVDATLTRADLLSYIETDETDRFAVGSVYYNQTQDVHPPLYYWLLNFASSFTPNSFSMWTGLILNLVIYAVTLLMLWLLAIRLFSSWKLALAAVVLYGLSNVGISTMLMIRMYCLLTLFTVLLAYWFVCLYQRQNQRLYFAIGITILLGMLTQYYFVFYAFFLCGAFLLYDLFAKKWKDALLLTASGCGAIAVFVLIWPAVITHLTRDALVSGGNAIENMTNVSNYGQKFWVYFYSSFLGLRTSVKLSLIAGAVLLLLVPVWIKRRKDMEVDWKPLLVILPCAAAFVAVVIFSPVRVLRYVYNIMPVFVLACTYLLYLIVRILDFTRITKWVEFLIPAVCLLWMITSFTTPDYLGKEHESLRQSLAPYTDAPCVYFTDNNWIMMTQDLMELTQFENVFTTNDPGSPALKQYLDHEGSAETIVVYVDTDEEWSSGFDAEQFTNNMMQQYDFTKKELLFRFGGSETYRLFN